MGAPTLQTQRLTIRPWLERDVEPWVAMCADERVMRYFPGTIDREGAIADAARLAARLDEKGYGFWVAERCSDDAFVGVLALGDVPEDLPFAPAFEVGWRLVSDAWGFGLATEGARALVAFAFETLARIEIVAMTARLNVPSQRVMQRLAMTTDATDDFDRPRVPEGSALRPHVLYRVRRSGETLPRR